MAETWGTIAVSAWNAVRRRALALSNLVLGPGLSQSQSPNGRIVRTSYPPRTFTAKLMSGSSGGPYVFRRVVPNGTAWKDMVPYNDNRTAYEANLRSTPIGRVVRMMDVNLGTEVRFFRPVGTLMGTVETCCPERTLPGTLYLHDMHGIHPIVHGYPIPDITGAVGWQMCYTVSGTGFAGVGVGTVDDPAPVLSATVTTAVTWVVYCHPGLDSWDSYADVWTWDLFNPPSDPDAVPGFGLPFPADCVGAIGFEQGGNTYNGQATRNGRLVNICVTCSPLGLQFGTNVDASITLGYIYGLDPYALHGVGDLIWFVTETADPPDVVVDVVPTVTRCVAGVAVPVVGATAELYERGGVTPVATGTTDPSGEVHLPTVHAGAHRLEVSEGTCTAAVPLMVGICGEDVVVPVDLCCGKVCLTLKDRINDDLLAGVDLYVPVGTHRYPDGIPIPTDGSGRACIELTAAETATLPRSPGTCTPLLKVTALKDGFLRSCAAFELACTGTPPEEEFFLDPLDTDHDGTPDFVSGIPVCEDTAGCSGGGYAERGLVPNRPQVVFEAEVLGTDAAWHDVTGQSGLHTFVFNGGVLSGTPSGSPWESDPYSLTSPDIEHSWTSSLLFSPPMEVTGGVMCVAPFTSIAAWLRRGTGSSSGLIVRLYGGGVGQVTIPGANPVGCSEELEFMELRMPFSYEPCIDSEPWSFDTGWIVVAGGAGGLNYRYRVQGSL